MSHKRFATAKPCDACPFRRGTPLSLTLKPARIEAFADQFTSSEGGAFPCHKTAEANEEGFQSGGGSLECGGAILFAEKNGNATQYMRISERIGCYDAREYESEELRALVWDDADEWLDAAKRAQGKAKRR